jgi:glycosyltransferase involved in cell wall biosynthesis
MGAEGITVTGGHDIVMADDAEAFAAAVIRVLEEPQFGRRIADNLYHLVKEQYGLDVLRRQARGILSALDLPAGDRQADGRMQDCATAAAS